MAGIVSLKTIGNWDKQIGVPLKDAMAVSMDIIGRSGEEACKHAIILMAQSARALTPQARKRRRVRKDKHGQYVLYDKPSKNQKKIYRWKFSQERQHHSDFEGTWEGAQKIGKRGLAKQSWMWGLKALTAKAVGKPISGVGVLKTIKSDSLNGYLLENRLDYITKIMPPGWERTVEVRAGNKIMAQARNKLQRQWRKAMNLPRGAKISNENLSRFFSKV